MDRNYHDLFDLSGRVLIVTGGTGHLGREISRGLASFGAHVIAVGRNPERFVELQVPNVECVQCDVQDEAAFAAVVADANKRYGRLDGLVNNANAAKRESWDELDTPAWKAGLDAALTHYFTCIKAVAPYLLKQGRGAIVNTSTILGFLAPNAKMHPEGVPGPAAHHVAAKAAVLQLTRSLAAQWATQGIRVNAVSPGWFPKKRGTERPDFIEGLTSRTPMARIGQPSEIVGAFVFLLSDASSFVTGQNLVVDGGYSLW